MKRFVELDDSFDMRDVNARELFKSCDRVKAVETGPEKGIVLYNHKAINARI